MTDNRGHWTRQVPWGLVIAMVLIGVGAWWWIQPDPVAVPKPMGQVRIALPDTGTTRYTSPCGSSFRMPTYMNVERNQGKDDRGCWYNLFAPRFQSRIHITEVPVEDNLSALLQDAQSMVFGHEIAASGLKQQRLDLPGKSGVLFILEGPVATPLQFFMTDSTDHFLRGSLYFNHRPNPDSTAPVLERMESDVRFLMETLKWKP